MNEAITPEEGMHLLNIEPIETFPQTYIQPGALFTLIDWTPGSQFAVQPAVQWHDWTDPLVFQEGDLMDEQSNPYSLLEVFTMHFIPIEDPQEIPAIDQEVIEKYRALQGAGKIAGYAIWYADGISAYFPQWKDSEGVWHLFKNDQANRFVRSGDLAVIEAFIRNFTHLGIEYH